MPSFNVAGRSRSTTSCNVTGLQVRPDLPALPNLFRTSNQAVDPSEKYQCTGAPTFDDGLRQFDHRSMGITGWLGTPDGSVSSVGVPPLGTLSVPTVVLSMSCHARLSATAKHPIRTKAR